MSKHFDWRKAMLHGVNLAADNSRSYDDGAAWTAMWELLCESARVSRSFEAPPAPGHPDKAIWPDVPDEITPWQRQMAYLRGELDEMPVDDPLPPMPMAHEVTRAEMVLDLWHRHALMRYATPMPAKRAIYRWADGGSLGQVIRMTGLRRSEVLALRVRACTEMLRGAGVC